MSQTSQPPPSTQKADLPMPNPTAPTSGKFRSTWNRGSKKGWGISHAIVHYARLDPQPEGYQYPVSKSNDKIPVLRERDFHRWIAPRAALPVLLHYLYTALFSRNLHPVVVFFSYTTSYKLFAISTMSLWRQLGSNYGFLDEKCPRDCIPDDSVGKVLLSLLNTGTYRPMLATILAYERSETPQISYWFPLQLTLYSVILDFWFYWYHRALHEVSFLWKHHRTHHLTKHPNTALTLFADEWQEVFDIVVIPLATYLTMKGIYPINFYEWWICTAYITFIELAGHSGVRIVATPPGAGLGILKFFCLELIIEDHDLHHREGYRKSGNYGKQTRLWDHLFGTALPRRECVENNIAQHDKVIVPW